MIYRRSDNTVGYYEWERKNYSLTQLEWWLIGPSAAEKQQDYKEQRKKWRKDHDIPDRLNVKGANVIPARYS